MSSTRSLTTPSTRIITAAGEIGKRCSDEQAALLLEAIVGILHEPAGLHELLLTTHNRKLVKVERRRKERIA